MSPSLRNLSLSLLAVALMASTPAWAATAELGAAWGPRLSAVIKSANLTTDQQTRVQGILERAASQRNNLRKQEHDLRDQIADKLMSAGSVSVADVSSQLKQADQLHEQLALLMVQIVVDIRSLLSPAQIGHLADVHQQMKSLNEKRRTLLQDDLEE